MISFGLRGVVALVAFAAVVAACNTVPTTPVPTAPTATPVPTATTATPVPTALPDPTATPSPYPGWYNAPPDAAHQAAKQAIVVISASDAALGLSVAGLTWVRDGIVEPENAVLDHIQAVVIDDLWFAITLVETTWLNDPDLNGQRADDALVTLRAAYATEPGLNPALAAYEWMDDGISASEAYVLSAVATLADAAPETAGALAVSPGFVDGAALAHTGGAASSMTSIRHLLELPIGTEWRYWWLMDGINQIEADGLHALNTLVRSPSAARTSLPGQLTDDSWLGEGFIAGDVEALRALRSLLETADRVTPGLAAVIANYDWIPQTRRIRYIEKLEALSGLLETPASTNPGVAETVIAYSWLVDDVSIHEFVVMEALSNLLEAGEAANSDWPTHVVLYPWLADGITSAESRAVGYFPGIVAHAGGYHGAAFATLTGHGWIQDDINGNEWKALQQFEQLFGVAGPEFPIVLDTIVAYEWVQNGIDPAEAEIISTLAGLIQGARWGHMAALEPLVGYTWLSDGIGEDDRHKLAQLHVLMWTIPSAHRGIKDTIIDTIFDYEWVSKDFGDNGHQVLQGFFVLVGSSGNVRMPFLEQLAAQPWMADGISDDERDFVNRLVEIGRPIESFQPELQLRFMNDLNSLPWIVDGVSPEDFLAITGIHSLLAGTGSLRPDYAEQVLDYPWIADGPTLTEADRLSELTSWIVASSLNGRTDIGDAFLGYSWVADGLDETEAGWLETARRNVGSIHALDPKIVDGQECPSWIPMVSSAQRAGGLREAIGVLRFLDSGTSDGVEPPASLADGVSRSDRVAIDKFYAITRLEQKLHHEVFDSLGCQAWVADGISSVEESVIRYLEILLSYDAAGIQETTWFKNGITEEDFPIILVLDGAKSRSERSYQDLRDDHHVQSRVLSLPLTGDMTLSVVRHTPFPFNDPSLDLMEDIVTILEDFMGVPFPSDPLVLGIMEESDDYWRNRVGGGFALGSHIVIAAPRYGEGFHLAVFHEVAHVYWGGHTGSHGWWTEGTAGFLPDIARARLGEQSLADRRAKLLRDVDHGCWRYGIDNIQEYLDLQQNDPEESRKYGICTYAFGEQFLIDMYLLLGEDVTSAAMRQLYLDAQATGWHDPITERKIYEAFLTNAPEYIHGAYNHLYKQLHGGTYEKDE